MAPATAADEGRHAPSTSPLWQETWHFDFATPDASLGGHLRLGTFPNQGVSWLWAAVVGDGRRLVTVVEHEAPIPRLGSLDLRCDALWADLVCESPMEHWSVGLEAFGVALDEPADAYRGLRGDRIGVGFDLGWETVGEAQAGGRVDGVGRADVACDVSGEVLLGDEVVQLDGWGSRSHTWGVDEWWAAPWEAGAGRLDDGTRWCVRPGDGAATPGAPGPSIDLRVGEDGRGGRDGDGHRLPGGASVTVDDLRLRCGPLHLSPVPIVAPDGRHSRVVHAMARTTADDGRTGAAWLVSNRPGA